MAKIKPPFLSFVRPFHTTHDVRPSRYYPYGTDAGGQYLLHHGVDIGNPLGTPVLAVADGVVIFAGRDDKVSWGPTTDFYGNLVVLEHKAMLDGRPLVTLYGHVSRTLAAVGDHVRAGTPIAEVGAEGIALGPHLHLEVRRAADDYGSTINPELMLQTLPGHGIIVGRVLDAAGLQIPEQQVSLYSAAGAGEWRAQTTTYPDEHVYGAAGWRENFVFGDTRAGRYRVSAEMDGVRVSEPVTIASGTAWLVTLRLDVKQGLDSKRQDVAHRTAESPSATPSAPPPAAFPPGVSQPN